MRNIKKTIYIYSLIMFTVGLHAQDITNWEKSKLEAYVKDLAIKEVNANPAFEEFRISNSTPVNFERFVSDQDYSYITDEEDMFFGIRKNDSFIRTTFFNGKEEDFIVVVIVLLRTSEIKSILRGDNMGFSGDLILNKK